MQVVETSRTVDIFGMPGRGCDPPVDRLAELCDHHEIVDTARA
jgi:hypothetical protein